MGGISRLTATEEQRATLMVLAGSRDRGEADRARAVLLTLAGWTSPRIAAAFGVREDTVRLWRRNFVRGGVEALKASVAPGPAPVKSEAALRVVTPLLEQPVADRRNWTIPRLQVEIEAREGVRISRSQLSKGAAKKSSAGAEATHWTGAAMAKADGVSVSSMQRVWRAHGLQPHRVRQFKLSNDPDFVDKLRDIVGLYVDPRAHAVVLSVDEKSQIQALDRTQPSLPLKKGRAGTMTHDYKRHGTTTLFAAMNVLDGTVIGRNVQRHRHQEFILFLNAVEREVPAGKTIHAILDNYAAHNIPPCGDGSPAIRAGRSTSLRPRPPGPTRSKASSPS